LGLDVPKNHKSIRDPDQWYWPNTDRCPPKNLNNSSEIHEQPLPDEILEELKPHHHAEVGQAHPKICLWYRLVEAHSLAVFEIYKNKLPLE